MKLFDNHSHSEFSPDGRMTMEQSIVKAAETGLAGIAITDHYDMDIPGGSKAFSFDPEEHHRKVDELTGKYGLPIKVLKGIELGLQPHCLDKIRDFASGYRFDTVIASLHFIDGLDPYYGEYYQGLERKQAYGKYFEDMYFCIRNFEDFDILGHFDYIARYAPYSEQSIMYRDFPDLFDEIFKYLVYNDKALEINSNTYRIRNGRTPQLDINILKRYRELGGDSISLGSDAHETVRIGENLEKYAALALSAGIKYTCHFDRRRKACDKIDL